MKKLKLPKLNLACAKDAIRPVMSYIMITKEHTVATDAHILVVHKTRELFNDEFVSGLKGTILIHRKNWIKLTKLFENYKLDYDNKYITVFYKDYSDYIPIFYASYLNKYPDWEKVIPKKGELEEVKRIAFNPLLLSCLADAIQCTNLSLYFNGENKAILCKPLCGDYYDCYGIIMPMAIND